MGMSRSSTCVLAYLILRHQMSADEALNTVSIRQIVNCLSHPLTLEVDFIWIFCCGRTFLYAKILLFCILYALMVWFDLGGKRWWFAVGQIHFLSKRSSWAFQRLLYMFPPRTLGKTIWMPPITLFFFNLSTNGTHARFSLKRPCIPCLGLSDALQLVSDIIWEHFWLFFHFMKDKHWFGQARKQADQIKDFFWRLP